MCGKSVTFSELRNCFTISDVCAEIDKHIEILSLDVVFDNIFKLFQYHITVISPSDTFAFWHRNLYSYIVTRRI